MTRAQRLPEDRAAPVGGRDDSPPAYRPNVLAPHVTWGDDGVHIHGEFGGCGLESPHVHAHQPTGRRHEWPPAAEMLEIARELGVRFGDTGPPLSPCGHSHGLRLTVLDDDRPHASLAICAACQPWGQP
jgi:hypothetical protein